MGGPGLFGAVALGLAGGGLLLWWKSKQNDPCAGLSGEELLICKGAGIAGDVLNVLADAGKALTTNPSAAFDDERQRRKAINDGLNGAPDTSITGSVTGFAWDLAANIGQPLSWNAPPYRYANGCEPYYAAPGWSKCKAGTLDMYEMAVEQASGGGLSNPRLLSESEAHVAQVFETPEALAAATANNQKAHDNGDDSHWYQVRLGASFDPTPAEPLNKDHYGTGASGDPITQGPWVDDAGTIWWLVRGRRFNAPAGKVPLAIAMRVTAHGFETQADRDAKVIALTDAQAVSLIAVGSYGAGSGTGSTTTYSGCAAILADKTLTWNGSGWARLKAGQKRNLGPCAGAAASSGSGQTKANTTTTTIGTGVFGFGILGL